MQNMFITILRALFRNGAAVFPLCLSITLSAQNTPPWVKNEPIGIWHLNSATTDSSRFGHNGTIVGTVTQTDGRFGYAYHFDGSSYIDCGSVDLNSTGEFSVSAWVRSTDSYVYQVWRIVVSKIGAGGGPLELFLGDGRSGSLPGTAGNYMAWNGGLGVYDVFSPYDLSRNAKDGTWHHLAITFKSGSQIVYFDGVQVASDTATNPLPNTSATFRIGGTDFGAYHHPWIGDIDEVSAYNRVLSPSEIQMLAQDDTSFTIWNDRDGLNDLQELAYQTDSTNFDTNGDGLADGVNVFTGSPPLGTDTDSDGIANIQEIINGTSPVLNDTDGDGVPDNLDPFPLDRYRKMLPPVNLSDHTPPVITLQEPF
jgi:hypothetical protein